MSTDLTNIEKGFTEIIKKRYIEKYADDAIKLLEDFKRIEAAHEQFSKWVKDLESEENIPKVIKAYKKARSDMETLDMYEFND
jgi:hypothetical protein